MAKKNSKNIFPALLEWQSIVWIDVKLMLYEFEWVNLLFIVSVKLKNIYVAYEACMDCMHQTLDFILKMMFAYGS